MLEFALWMIAIALVLVGIAGVLLPALPGPALVFAGITLAAYIDGFTRIGFLALGLIAVLAVTAIGIDYAAVALGAKKFGGSYWGIAGAVIGLVVGLPFGPVGILAGPLVGATGLELVGARKTGEEALKSGFGTLVGFILGTAVRYALVLTMLGVAMLDFIAG